MGRKNKSQNGAQRNDGAVATWAVKTKVRMERSAMTERPKIQTHF